MINQDQNILEKIDRSLTRAFPSPRHRDEQCSQILSRVHKIQRRTFYERFSAGALTIAAVLVLLLAQPWSSGSETNDLLSQIAEYYYPEQTQAVEFDVTGEAILDYLVRTENIYQLEEIIDKYTIN